jgi:hypothetical protein
MAVVDELLKSFTGTDRTDRSALIFRFQGTLHSVKKQFLDEIEQFEKKGLPDGNSFKAWLDPTRERYKQWLSRL